MIISDLQTYKEESQAFHPLISYAVRWLSENNLYETDAGRYDILKNGDMFCMIQEVITEPFNTRRPESHFEYLDVQLVIHGRESIGVARKSKLNIPEEYRPDHDVVFYNEIDNESVFILSEGMFAVFLPSDIHRPCCEVGKPAKIKKAIIKIRMELFNRSPGSKLHQG